MMVTAVYSADGSAYSRKLTFTLPPTSIAKALPVRGHTPYTFLRTSFCGSPCSPVFIKLVLHHCFSATTLSARQPDYRMVHNTCPVSLSAKVTTHSSSIIARFMFRRVGDVVNIKELVPPALHGRQITHQRHHYGISKPVNWRKYRFCVALSVSENGRMPGNRIVCQGRYNPGQ